MSKSSFIQLDEPSGDQSIARESDDQVAESIGTPPQYRRAGAFVFVSGVTAGPSDGVDIGMQTESCIARISDILEEVGGGLENLVEVTTYLRSMANFVDYNEAYGQYFSLDGPARTTVAVDHLAHPKALIEMRGVAYIAQNTNANS